MEGESGELLPREPGDKFKKVEQGKPEEEKKEIHHPVPKSAEPKDEESVVMKTVEELGRIIESEKAVSPAVAPARPSPRLEERRADVIGRAKEAAKGLLRGLRGEEPKPQLSPEQAERIEAIKRSWDMLTQEGIQKIIDEQLKGQIPENVAQMLVQWEREHHWDFYLESGEKFENPRRFLESTNLLGRIWAVNGLLAELAIGAYARGKELSAQEREEIMNYFSDGAAACMAEEQRQRNEFGRLQKPGAEVETIERKKDYSKEEWEEIQSLYRGPAQVTANLKEEFMKREGGNARIISRDGVETLEKLYRAYARMGKEKKGSLRDKNHVPSRDNVKFCTQYYALIDDAKVRHRSSQ